MKFISVAVLVVSSAFGLPRVSTAAEVRFSVMDEGAVADGKTLCTPALQRAIDRCAAAGGGTVFFPAGTYLSGTLVLKSWITLHLEAGATLLGSPDPRQYPAQHPAVRSYTDNYFNQALLAGENLERVSVVGRGTIDGNGAAFRWKEYRDRPCVIRLIKCQDVLIEGVTLRNSPMWMQHYLACERVRIHGVRVFNHASHNNDGLDLDGCHDVTVSDCVFDSDDDALCLKSTLDRACENITITNCVLSSHCNAFKLGTESNGGFKRITFSNCAILSPRYSRAIHGADRGMSGIALETVDGGQLDGITITNVSIAGVNVPLFIRLGNRARPFLAGAPNPPVGSFRNVIISNVVATGAGRIGCSLTGLPGSCIENVTLANLNFSFEGGGEPALAHRAVPERPEAYPESRMFGDLPAYGLYVRHVRGLKISDVRLDTAKLDARHAIVCDDVRDLDIAGINLPSAPGAAALFRFSQVADARVSGCRARGTPDVFLALEGGDTAGVVLAGNDITATARLIEPAAGVAREAWRVYDSASK